MPQLEAVRANGGDDDVDDGTDLGAGTGVDSEELEASSLTNRVTARCGALLPA